MKEILITSSVLILVLTGLRFLFRGRISRRLQYALWLLVLARLLIPVSLPASSLSVLNGAQSLSERASSISAPPAAAPLAVSPAPTPDTAMKTADHAVIPSAGASDTVAQTESGPSTAEVLRLVWLAGAALTLLWFLATNLLFARRLRRTRVPCEAAAESPVPVYITPAVVSPCLFGLLRPAVYLTPRAASTPESLRHVLTHELCHRRHGDHIWSALRGLCLAIYWFDPLVWLAAILSRADGELACDEAAIAALGPDCRLAYGRTLVDMVAVRRAPSGILCAATTMTSGKRGLRERLTEIVRDPKHLLWAALIVLVAAILLVGCTFTGAQDAEDAEDAAANTLTCSEVTDTVRDALPDDVADWDAYRWQYDVDGSHKGLRVWAEVWENGAVSQTVDGLSADLFGKPDALDLALLDEETDAARTVRLYLRSGGAESYAELPLPTEPDLNARAASWLGSGSEPSYGVTVDRPVILLCLAYQSGENGTLSSFDCEYLTEEPSRLEEYECAVVVKCVFTGGDAGDYVIGTDSDPALDAATSASYEVSFIREFDGQGEAGKAEPLTGLPETLAGDVVLDAIAKSAAWPAEYPGGRENVFLIRQTLTDGEVSDYYAYRLDDGTPVLHVSSGYYTTLSEDLMLELEQAAGVDSTKTYSLEAAIRQAILRENADRRGGGECPTAAYTLLADGTGPTGGTVYCDVLYLDFALEDDRLAEKSGYSGPVALTFSIDGDGAYTLEEYWTPDDGEGYAASIREKFPADAADAVLDPDNDRTQLHQLCYRQAIDYFGLDLSAEIAGLIDEICDKSSSIASDFALNENDVTVRQLLYYGDETLRYIFGEFEKGGQTDFRGAVMGCLMEALLGGENVGVEAADSQAYYDEWKAHVLRLYDRNPLSYFRENAPKSYLLLEVLGLAESETAADVPASETISEVPVDDAASLAPDRVHPITGEVLEAPAS